jgi:predicted NAD-dependent protein-ADP-ribosyltransferase YbiA (DUF1768 family)
MVLSKLNKNVKYVEFKRINSEDLNRESDLYEMKIKNVPVIITLGVQNNSFMDDGVVFFPIYLIKYNMKSIQIGVFELLSSEIIKHIDEIDIEEFDLPILYSFVTKDFLEKTRLNPKDEYKLTNEIPENEDENISDEKEDGKENKKENKKEKEKESEKESEKEDENPKNIEEEIIYEPEVDSNSEKSEIEISDIETPEVEIQDVRKPYFSKFSKRLEPSLKEETEEISKEIRDQFKENEAITWVQKFLKNKNYSLKDNEGDGDCFFYTIRDAFVGLGHETSVAKLREILVANATEEKFHYYKELYTEYSQTANELKEKAKRLKNTYEDIQQKLKDEKDKTTKVALLKKGKEIKEERNSVIEEYNALQPLIRDVKFIANVPDFKHFKSKLRTSHYFADSWSIGIIEKALNIKCIILSSDHYSNGDMEAVVNCAVTDVSQLIDDKEPENFYEPDYYVILDHTGIHYKLVTYKNRRIFTFKELPYDLRHIIVNKCMERRNIFNYIPEFIQMKGERAKGFDADKLQQLCDARLYDLFDENIEFVYHSNARDGLPGKLNGEKIPDEEIKHYLKLNKIKNWRKKLSNEWIEPFEYDKHKWASVKHLYEASKYKSDIKKYIQYSLDSESDLSKNVDLIKIQPKHKVDADFKIKRNQILQEALLAKWSQNDELKQLLLDTGKAKLSEFVRGDEPEPSCILMDVRDKIRKMD